MKTTLELPDELMRAAKIRAAQEGRKLKDVMADLVRRGLADAADSAGTRVQLPLVECAHEARPDDEMTPMRVADVLARGDAAGARSAP